ncbi:MAG: hypothetical protein ABIH92_00580 [Nanoarchaeota archaeon]
MKKRRRKPFGLLSNFIFGLNVFIALMIITGSWLLVETEFGKTAMSFGFVMLAVSTLLKVAQKW